MMPIKPIGPKPTKVYVVADYPSVEAERKGIPLYGSEAELLARMLNDAGLLFTETRIAYLCPKRPYNTQAKYVWTASKSDAKYISHPVPYHGAFYAPEILEAAKALEQDILETSPNVIVTLGDIPLHYFTHNTSPSKWRGSLLEACISGKRFKLIPTFSPAQIHRVWEWRGFSVRDLQRVNVAQGSPDFPVVPYNFIIQPTFEEAKCTLQTLLVRLNTARTLYPIAADIETIARHIACVGFAWSKYDAMCIPLVAANGAPFYTFDEELELICLMQKVLCHPRVNLIGQNFAYDIQHFIRHWGFRPRIGFDTMLAQHVCFPGIPKDLGFLASMYCENYVYWKDELTDYNKMPDDVIKFWTYNCKDCCNTWEIAHVIGN